MVSPRAQPTFDGFIHSFFHWHQITPCEILEHVIYHSSFHHTNLKQPFRLFLFQSSCSVFVSIIVRGVSQSWPQLVTCSTLPSLLMVIYSVLGPFSLSWLSSAHSAILLLVEIGFILWQHSLLRDPSGVHDDCSFLASLFCRKKSVFTCLIHSWSTCECWRFS